MLAAAIIVFREVIEAGLIIGIVLAATRGATGSRLSVAGGVASGLLGACVVAFFMSAIAGAFDGFGQEMLNVVILATAVIMLAWHNIWMAGHGRELAKEMSAAGRDFALGKGAPLALAVVVGTAVLREGSEVVLFLYGVAVSNGGSAASLAAGCAAGLGLGAVVSALTYFGLLRIPPRHLFTVTSWLIAFLAAGMAAQAAGFLQQSGAVEQFAQTVWDSSAYLSESSVAGRILHTLIGYSEAPSLLQLIAYVVTLAAITGLTRLARPAPRPKLVSAE